jgi:hypothetical protein
MLVYAYTRDPEELLIKMKEQAKDAVDVFVVNEYSRWSIRGISNEMTSDNANLFAILNRVSFIAAKSASWAKRPNSKTHFGSFSFVVPKVDADNTYTREINDKIAKMASEIGEIQGTDVAVFSKIDSCRKCGESHLVGGCDVKLPEGLEWCSQCLSVHKASLYCPASEGCFFCKDKSHQSKSCDRRTYSQLGNFKEVAKHREPVISTQPHLVEIITGAKVKRGRPPSWAEVVAKPQGQVQKPAQLQKPAPPQRPSVDKRIAHEPEEEKHLEPAAEAPQPAQQPDILQSFNAISAQLADVVKALKLNTETIASHTESIKRLSDMEKQIKESQSESSKRMSEGPFVY